MPLLRTILPWQVQEDDLEERRRQERENLFARLDSIHDEWQAEQAAPRMVPEPPIGPDLPADSVVPQGQAVPETSLDRQQDIFARLDSVHAEWQAEQAAPGMVPEPSIDPSRFMAQQESTRVPGPERSMELAREREARGYQGPEVDIAPLRERIERGADVQMRERWGPQFQRLLDDPAMAARMEELGGPQTVARAREMAVVPTEEEVREVRLQQMSSPFLGPAEQVISMIGSQSQRAAARIAEQPWVPVLNPDYQEPTLGGTAEDIPKYLHRPIAGAEAFAEKRRNVARDIEALSADASELRSQRIGQALDIPLPWAEKIGMVGDALASGTIYSGAILLTGGAATPAMMMLGLGEIDQEAEERGLSPDNRSFLTEVGTAYLYAKIERISEFGARSPAFQKLLGKWKNALPRGLESDILSGGTPGGVFARFMGTEALEELAQESLIMGYTGGMGEGQQYAPEEIVNRLGTAAVMGAIGSMPLGALGAYRKHRQIQGELERPFRALGLDRNATMEEVDKAFIELASPYNPDNGPVEQDADFWFRTFSNARDEIKQAFDAEQAAAAPDPTTVPEPPIGAEDPLAMGPFGIRRSREVRRDELGQPTATTIPEPPIGAQDPTGLLPGWARYRPVPTVSRTETLPSGQPVRQIDVDFDTRVSEDGYHVPDGVEVGDTIEIFNIKGEKVPVEIIAISEETGAIKFKTPDGTEHLLGNEYVLDDINSPEYVLKSSGPELRELGVIQGRRMSEIGDKSQLLAKLEQMKEKIGVSAQGQSAWYGLIQDMNAVKQAMKPPPTLDERIDAATFIDPITRTPRPHGDEPGLEMTERKRRGDQRRFERRVQTQAQEQEEAARKQAGDLFPEDLPTPERVAIPGPEESREEHRARVIKRLEEGDRQHIALAESNARRLRAMPEDHQEVVLDAWEKEGTTHYDRLASMIGEQEKRIAAGKPAREQYSPELLGRLQVLVDSDHTATSSAANIQRAATDRGSPNLFTPEHLERLVSRMEARVRGETVAATPVTMPEPADLFTKPRAEPARVPEPEIATPSEIAPGARVRVTTPSGVGGGCTGTVEALNPDGTVSVTRASLSRKGERDTTVHTLDKVRLVDESVIVPDGFEIVESDEGVQILDRSRNEYVQVPLSSPRSTTFATREDAQNWFDTYVRDPASPVTPSDRILTSDEAFEQYELQKQEWENVSKRFPGATIEEVLESGTGDTYAERYESLAEPPQTEASRRRGGPRPKKKKGAETGAQTLFRLATMLKNLETAAVAQKEIDVRATEAAARGEPAATVEPAAPDVARYTAAYREVIAGNPTPGITRVRLNYGARDPKSDPRNPIHIFKPVTQVGDYIALKDPAEQTALLFPNPEAGTSAASFKDVFPTARPETLSEVVPLRVRINEDGSWGSVIDEPAAAVAPPAAAVPPPTTGAPKPGQGVNVATGEDGKTFYALPDGSGRWADSLDPDRVRTTFNNRAELEQAYQLARVSITFGSSAPTGAPAAAAVPPPTIGGPTTGRPEVRTHLGGQPVPEPELPQTTWRGRTLSRAVEGREEQTFFPGDKRKVLTRYTVVEASDLYASNDPYSFEKRPETEYPGTSQGRVYDGERGKQARDDVEMQSQPANYDIVRALDPTVMVTGGVPTITPSGVVVAGNQRAMMVQRALDDEGVREKYQESLREEAVGLGLDAKAIDGFDNPVLVRVITDPTLDLTDEATLEALNRASDVTDTKAKDLLSDAATRASHLRAAPRTMEHFMATSEAEQTLSEYIRTSAGRQFVRLLLEEGVIAPSERAAWMDAEGVLTESGRSALARMFRVAAIGDADAIATAPAIALNKLDSSLGALVQARAVGEEWGLGPALVDGFSVLNEAQEVGRTVDDVIDQRGLFGDIDPLSAAVARFLEKPVNEIRPALKRYAAWAREAESQKGTEDMFGTAPVTPADAQKEIFGVDPRGEGPDLFGEVREDIADYNPAQAIPLTNAESDRLDNLVSAMETGEGQAGAGFDRSIFRKLGAKMYKGNIAGVATKEGIQNAIDAVRGRTDGKIRVNIDQKTNTIIIQDNGTGMAPSVARNEFLDIGGSFKEQGAAGGYGLAKVGLLAHAEWFEVVTVFRQDVAADPDLFDAPLERGLHRTIISGSSDDWMNGTLQYQTERIAGPGWGIRGDAETDLGEWDAYLMNSPGTMLTIQISEEAEPQWYMAERYMKAFNEFNATGAEMEFINRLPWDAEGAVVEPLPQEFTYPEKPDEVRQIKKGRVEIYSSNETTDGVVQVAILNNGLYQFNDQWYMQDKGSYPKKLVFDVRSDATTTDIEYPFNTSRENLTGDADKLVEKYKANLALVAAKKRKTDIEAAVQTPFLLSAGTGGLLYKTTETISDRTRQMVLDSRTTAGMESVLRQSTREVADVLVQAGLLYGKQGSFEFGLSIDEGWLGLNVDQEGIAEIIGGEKGKPNLILVNPFVIWSELIEDGYRDASPENLARKSMATIVHEVAHNRARGHKKEFAGVLTRAQEYFFYGEAAEALTRMEQAWGEFTSDRRIERAYKRAEAEWKAAEEGDADVQNVFEGVTDDIDLKGEDFLLSGSRERSDQARDETVGLAKRRTRGPVSGREDAGALRAGERAGDQGARIEPPALRGSRNVVREPIGEIEPRGVHTVEEDVGEVREDPAEIDTGLTETYDAETGDVSFLNTEDGMLSRVTQREDGQFAVTLTDVDAAETLPTVRVFPELERATAHARSLVREDPAEIDTDLFGEPIVSGPAQADLLPEGEGPQGMSAATNDALAMTSLLKGRYESGALSPNEMRRYEDAQKLLRSVEGGGLDPAMIRHDVETTPTDEYTMEMFPETTPKEVREQTVTKFGSVEAGAKVAASVVEADEKHGIGTFAASMEGVMSFVTRAKAVAAGVKNIAAWVDMIGHNVVKEDGTPDQEKVAAIIQAGRNPKAEHIQNLAIGSDGNIVHHVLSRSGKIASANINFVDVVDAVSAAKRAGGMSVVAHNHPSGRVKPSTHDIQMTRDVILAAEHQGTAFGGHYIINHNKALIITAENIDEIASMIEQGATEKEFIDKFGVRLKGKRSALEWTSPDAKQVKNQDQIFEYLKGLPEDESRVDVMFMSSTLDVVSYQPHHVGELATMAEWAPDLMRQVASGRLILGVKGQAAFDAAVAAAQTVPINIVEVLDVTDPENSAAVQGLLPKRTQEETFKLIEGVGEVREDEPGLEAGTAGALPMDEASRMERARAQGFDVDTPVYHGTTRPDRIAEVGAFDPARATSGPSAFFTEDPKLASAYALGKKGDTSRLAEGTGFNEMFKFDIGGGRTVNLDEIWRNLDYETRRTLRANLGRVTEDEEGEERFVWGGGPGGQRTWEYALQRNRNPIKAAEDVWLASGILHDREEKFVDVLVMAGLPRDMVTYDDPWASTPGVVPVFLRKGNVLDAQGTTAEGQAVLRNLIERLRALPQERIPDAERSGVDPWAKDTRYGTPGEWADQLESDLNARKKESFVWTSIPDQVSDEIRKMGYDTILDVGGKMGGVDHNVWIPLSPDQIRNPWAAFDPARTTEAGLVAEDPARYLAEREDVIGTTREAGARTGGLHGGLERGREVGVARRAERAKANLGETQGREVREEPEEYNVGREDRELRGEGSRRNETDTPEGWYDHTQLPSLRRQVGVEVKGAVARPLGGLKQTYRYYSESLTDTVRRQGGAVGEELAQRAERVIDKTKQLLGLWDEARSNVQKLVSGGPKGAVKTLERAQSAINYLQSPIKAREGQHPAAIYRNIQAAVEGDIPLEHMPKRVRQVVEAIRELNIATGEYFQSIGLLQVKKELRDNPQFALMLNDVITGKAPEDTVFRLFTPFEGGRVFLRMQTHQLQQIWMNPTTDLRINPQWDQLVQMLAHENNMDAPEVGRILIASREGTSKRMHAEIPRLFTNFPTDMRMVDKDGKPTGETVPLLWTHPGGYATSVTANSAHRAAFIEEFGQGLDDRRQSEAIDRAHQAGINPDDTHRLFRALSGMSETTPLDAPDAPAHDITAGWAHLMLIPRTMMLTRASVVNTFEVFGNIQAFGGGAGRLVKMTKKLAASEEGWEALQKQYARTGLAQTWVMNATLDRQRPLSESVPRIFREYMLRLFPTIQAWKFQEMQAAAMGVVLAEDMRAAAKDGGSSGVQFESDLFVAKHILEFTDDEVAEFRAKTASNEKYVELARRFASRSNTTLLSLPAEESRAANSPAFNRWIAFHRYSMMSVRNLDKVHVGVGKEWTRFKASDRSNKDITRLAGVMKTYALYMGGKTSSGVYTTFMLALLAGGVKGLLAGLKDFGDEPWEFMAKGFATSQLGPIYNMMTRLDSDRKIENLWMISAPLSVMAELGALALNSGRYQYMNAQEKTLAFFGRINPGPRAIYDIATAAGLTDTDPTRDLAITRYWKWMRDNDVISFGGDQGLAEADDRKFRANMRRAYNLYGREKQTGTTIAKADEFVNKALEVEGKEARNVAASIRARRLLTRVPDEQMDDLREFLGPELFASLETHDSIMDSWARSAGPPRGGTGRQRRRRTRTRR